MLTVPGIVGGSDAITHLAQNVTALAKNDLPGLLSRQSGASTQPIARTIRMLSSRPGKFDVARLLRHFILFLLPFSALSIAHAQTQDAPLNVVRFTGRV